MQQAHSSEKVLTFFQLTLEIYTLYIASCNVDYLLSIAVASMNHHYGILYIIITFVLLGEKYLEKYGMYHLWHTVISLHYYLRVSP